MTAYSPQIIRTLTDQVQTLTPLRESFQQLQQYYSSLTRDFNNLLNQSDLSEQELSTNLRYLEEVHRSLEREFGCCGQQLRQRECEQARAQMERNQQSVQAEALKKREMLEQQQSVSLQVKRKDLCDQNQKMSFTMSKYKEMIHNIELVIKGKEYENMDIEREVTKMELVNQKITQLNKNAEKAIDCTQASNEETVSDIHELESKLATYQKLVDAKQKQNKDSVSALIAKTEELQQLKNRKLYIEKLLEAQLGQQRDLTKTYGELDSILTVRKQKSMLVNQQNQEYEMLIAEESARQNKSRDQLLKLKSYLQTLTITNEHLYKELQNSCSRDREVQVMLSDKLEKLLVMNDKISENQIMNTRQVNHTSSLFKQSNISPKNLPKASYLPGQLFSGNGSPLAKQMMANRSVHVSHEMGSTWGSHSKQNRFTFDL